MANQSFTVTVTEDSAVKTVLALYAKYTQWNSDRTTIDTSPFVGLTALIIKKTDSTPLFNYGDDPYTLSNTQLSSLISAGKAEAAVAPVVSNIIKDKYLSAVIATEAAKRRIWLDSQIIEPGGLPIS